MITIIAKHFSLEKTITMWILIMLFLLTPFVFQHHAAGEGLFIPFNIAAWLVISWFICIGLFTLATKQQIVLPRRYWALLALPLGILVSGFITGIQLPVAWLFRILFIFGGAIFLFLLFQSNLTTKNINRILMAVALSTLVNAIICILQVHYADQLIDVLLSTSSGQPTGAFKQINTNASYLATGLLIAFYLISRPAHQWRQTTRQNVKMLLLTLTIALSAYIIMLSASRVGTLSVGAGFSIILISRWSPLRRKKTALLLVLIAFFGGAFMGSAGTGKLTNKFDNTFEQYSSARLGIYQVSINAIKQKPLFGYGIGSFDKVFSDQSAIYLEKHTEAVLADIPFVNHPHNEFFFWLIEGGVLSVTGIVIAAMAVILALFSVGWSRGGAYSALLLPISLHTQVELPFYLSAIHWFLFLLLVFIVLRHNTKSISFHPSRYLKLATKATAVLLLVVSTLFLSNTFRTNQEIYQYHTEGTHKVNLLKGALNNIYFNNYAERLIMAISADVSIAYNKKKNVTTFIKWAEPYIQVHPDYVVRTILVKAYRFLGQQKKMCTTLKKGLFLHPKNEKLQALNIEENCL